MTCKQGMGLKGIFVSFVAVAMALMTGCASSSAQRRPYLIRENLDNAARQLNEGHKDEAAALYKVVLMVSPTNTEARTGLASSGSSQIDLLTPSLLGINKSRRPTHDGVGWRIAMYPVNRVLDICDCFSFRAGLQAGLLADLHVTRAAQVMFGGSGGMELGWRERRDLFAGFGTDVGAAIGPFGAETESSSSFGTDGIKARTFSITGMSHPTDVPYQFCRDYWGIGGRVTAVIVAVGAEIHPVELADALAGFFFVDFLNDDIGHTRGMKFTSADFDAARDLLNTLRASEMRASLRGRTTAE